MRPQLARGPLLEEGLEVLPQQQVQGYPVKGLQPSLLAQVHQEGGLPQHQDQPQQPERGQVNRGVEPLWFQAKGHPQVLNPHRGPHPQLGQANQA